MYDPCKPTSLGNEYSSVACRKSDLIWNVKMVEGKESTPKELKNINDKGDKTVGLLLHMTK
jgi:hypothetical protein